jgi:hypothetical protein
MIDDLSAPPNATIMTEPTLTPAKLWKRMTADQRLKAARAFWLDEQATDDQIQAVMVIAQQKKFRPKFVLSLDTERKAKHLSGLLSLPETLAARALVIYHLADQREMMGAFLDALGIAHDNGLIQEENVKPDASKIADAVKKISGEFPAEDVRIYLDTLLCQDPETWGALSELRTEN